MLKQTTFLVCLSLYANFSSAQKLKEDKIDDFTKHHVMTTSWENITNSKPLVSEVRIRKIDSSLVFNFKFVRRTGLSYINDVMAVPELGELMFKLDNDSIITLYALKSAISCRGCGVTGLGGSDAQGLDVTYFNKSETDLQSLLNHKIIKLRAYTSIGYVENEVKEKDQDLIINELNLVNAK